MEQTTPLCLRCVRGRLALELRLLPAGRDWQVLLTGGNAHIGAVVLAEPVGSAGETGNATTPRAAAAVHTTPARMAAPCDKIVKNSGAAHAGDAGNTAGTTGTPGTMSEHSAAPGPADRAKADAATSKAASPPLTAPPSAVSPLPGRDPALAPASAVVADGVRLRLLRRTGHYDHEAALPLARACCRALGTTVCVSAGIHYDSISRAEIALLLAMARLLGARALRRLRAFQEEPSC